MTQHACETVIKNNVCAAGIPATDDFQSTTAVCALTFSVCCASSAATAAARTLCLISADVDVDQKMNRGADETVGPSVISLNVCVWSPFVGVQSVLAATSLFA